MDSEDLDMNYRLRALGYKVLFAPGSRVYHKLHGSRGIRAIRRDPILKNRLRFLAKHFPEKLPEHLFGFGEILFLPADSFEGMLDFIQKELPPYRKSHAKWSLQLNASAEALRDFRKRCFRTVPFFEALIRIRDFFAGRVRRGGKTSVFRS